MHAAPRHARSRTAARQAGTCAVVSKRRGEKREASEPALGTEPPGQTAQTTVGAVWNHQQKGYVQYARSAAYGRETWHDGGGVELGLGLEAWQAIAGGGRRRSARGFFVIFFVFGLASTATKTDGRRRGPAAGGSGGGGGFLSSSACVRACVGGVRRHVKVSTQGIDCLYAMSQ
ncbi:hypothetical protein BC567DRAFT_225301 [Phyllosticta citribraziliensis]